MKHSYSVSTAFLDLLFNILLGFATLLIILLAIIKIESAKPALENKNEFVITLNWNDAQNNDVDIWVLSPSGQILNFRNKEANGLFLQRDDIGNSGVDTVYDIVSGTSIIPLNQEIVNIRKIIPGTYVINAHMYSMRVDERSKLILKLYKINPYSEVKVVESFLDARGEEKTLLVFTVSADGSVIIEPTVDMSILSLGAWK